MSPVLANPLIKPDTSAIISARNTMNDLLAIRQDSSLFRLRTAKDVAERLRFHNTGPAQVPGVIVMSIDGQHPRRYDDARYKSVVTLFNVTKTAQTVTVPELAGRQLKVHKVQRKSSSDTLARTATYNNANGGFTIPPRTTVVFVDD